MTRILVVDDSHDTAEFTAKWFRLVGHDVLIAYDGYQAIDLARRQQPKYVLLDLGLPHLNDYQVAARLRQELDDDSSSSPSQVIAKRKTAAVH